MLAGLFLLLALSDPILYVIGAQTPEEFCQKWVGRFKSARSVQEIKKMDVAYYSKNGEFYAAATGLPGHGFFNKEPPNGMIVMIDYTGRITAWDRWHSASMISFYFDGYNLERKSKLKNDSWPERANLSKEETVHSIRKEISTVGRLKYEYQNGAIHQENRCAGKKQEYEKEAFFRNHD